MGEGPEAIMRAIPIDGQMPSQIAWEKKMPELLTSVHPREGRKRKIEKGKKKRVGAMANPIQNGRTVHGKEVSAT